MFILCFFFAKQIYNMLVFPILVWPGRQRKLIYTAPLEYFFTQIKVAMFGGRLPGLPGDRDADLQIRRARPLQERAQGFPALSGRDAGPFLARRAAGLFHRHADR